MVTGLDLIPAYLEQAKERAVAENLTATYHLGDMRALPWAHRFDCIVNWMSAYGYFGDEENRQVRSRSLSGPQAGRELAPGPE